MVQQKVIKPAMQSEILGVRGWWDTCCARPLCPQWDLLPLCGRRGAGAGAGRGQAVGDREPSLGKHQSWRFLSQGKLLEQTL